MPTLADCWRSAPGAFEQWLGAAIAALLGAAALYSTGPDLALQRGLVFVGGPLLWLSGLAPRLGEYLHAPARLRLLPLPLPALEHWRASAAIRRRGAALTALAGAVAIAVGTASHLPTREVAGLVGDWLWLSVVVVLVEPWAPAVAAWLGRRMPAESTAQRLQSGLAGGWTLPEASVHLYAPPLVLGLATALAIPGQLWLDLSIDGASPPSAVLVVAVAGPGLALGLRPWAASVYGRGMFEAVPWLAQATRTLAGPPVPSPLPGFVSRLRAPALRLLAAARQVRVPAALSHNAGRYLCNYLSWRAVEMTGAVAPPPLVTFVHVPLIRRAPLPRERLRRYPPLAMPDLVRAGEAVIQAAIAALHARN
jgi:hypothetical protein